MNIKLIVSVSPWRQNNNPIKTLHNNSLQQEFWIFHITNLN